MKTAFKVITAYLTTIFMNKQNSKQHELQKLKEALDRDREEAKENETVSELKKSQVKAIEINGLTNGNTIMFDYIDSKGVKTKGRILKINKVDQNSINGICLETNQFKKFKKENIVNCKSINIDTGEVKQLQTKNKKLVTTPKQRTAFYTKLKRKDLIISYKKLKTSPLLYLYITDEFINKDDKEQQKIIMSCIGIEEWVEAVYLKCLKDDFMEDFAYFIYDSNKLVKATKPEKERHINDIYKRIEKTKYSSNSKEYSP